MNFAEVHDLLSLIATVDNRRFDDATVATWHAILGDLPMADAQHAVLEHYQCTDRYLMPSHVRFGALAIARERHRVEREAREETLAAIEAANAVPTEDRRAEVLGLVRQVRSVLPEGKPDKLRYATAEWARFRRMRDRVEEPNPHFRGWQTPPDLSEPGEESA